MKINYTTGFLVLKEVQEINEKTMERMLELHIKSDALIKIGKFDMGLIYIGLLREELRANYGKVKFLSSYFTEDNNELFLDVKTKLDIALGNIQELKKKVEQTFEEYKKLLEESEKECGE